MSRQQRVRARNEAIRAEFARMSARHLRSDHIESVLAGQFHLSEQTIYRIVSRSGRYAERAEPVRSQLDLF